MKVVVVIPARYDSTRFAGKVLANETGKFLIQHTYEQATLAQTPEKVIIATDNTKVQTACESFGAQCVMTSAGHTSGTDRIAEAVKDIDVDIVVNVQADEPEIDPKNIDCMVKLLMDNPQHHIATLVTNFDDPDQIANPNIVKAIVDENQKAIYFSRSVIPYDREHGASGIGDCQNYLRHLGIYAYRKKFLLEITQKKQTKLEKIEKLEQLRAIENGYSIITAKVQHDCEGIDTLQQYQAFVKRFSKRT